MKNKNLQKAGLLAALGLLGSATFAQPVDWDRAPDLKVAAPKTAGAPALRGIRIEAQLSRAMKLEIEEINANSDCSDVLRDDIELGRQKDYSDDGDNGRYYEFHTEWTCAEPAYADPAYKNVMAYVEYQLDGELRLSDNDRPRWDSKNFVITSLGVRASMDRRRGI